jgi:acetoacetyl-CoA synthetase
MTADILWEASEQQKQSSHLYAFMQWLQMQKGLSFPDYPSLYQWSIDDVELFWRYFVEFANLFSFPDDKPVLSFTGDDFIGAKWFEGVSLNYAEAIFKNANDQFPAIVFAEESHDQVVEISWDQLYKQVASLAAWMKSLGLKKGDRVVSVLPNIPENVVAFLATQSIGAVWSSCSPDFGNDAIVQRFAQIEPDLLFATNRTVYNGKSFDKTEQISYLCDTISTIKYTVVLNKGEQKVSALGYRDWNDIMQVDGGEIIFEPLPFDHPLWVLYSSGTTGIPKAITHGVGGNLIEHVKVMLLHWDVKRGDRFFWYSTTGWMMWNFSISSLLVGATLVIYDGAPSYPNTDRIWTLAAEINIHHVGVGAAYLIHCQKSGLHYNANHFPYLKTIGSTGSPLTADAYAWVYEHVKSDVWLISLSGGTDVCSGFVGGSIMLPVTKGEIQCRLLGCDLDAIDEEGLSIQDELGEMVIKQPMPSMPIYFWNDEGNKKYRASYFQKYSGLWWHGDFITLTNRGSVIISGRSDATLNRDGVRIGTAEIYRVLDSFSFVADSLVVCIEKTDGSFFMPLFVKFKEGEVLSPEIIQLIKSELRKNCSPRHVPDAIYAVSDIPYTISGKKMEIPVKRILMGLSPEKSASLDSVRNPQSLKEFEQFVL